jgi:hypothetical protein
MLKKYGGEATRQDSYPGRLINSSDRKRSGHLAIFDESALRPHPQRAFACSIDIPTTSI